MGKINKKQKLKEKEEAMIRASLLPKAQYKRGYKPLPRFKGGCRGC